MRVRPGPDRKALLHPHVVSYSKESKPTTGAQDSLLLDDDDDDDDDEKSTKI